MNIKCLVKCLGCNNFLIKVINYCSEVIFPSITPYWTENYSRYGKHPICVHSTWPIAWHTIMDTECLTKLRSSSKGMAQSLLVPLERSKFTVFQDAEAVANRSGDRPSESVISISAP